MDFLLASSIKELGEKIENLSKNILFFASSLKEDIDTIELTFSKQDLLSLGALLGLYVQRTKNIHNKC